MPAPKDWTTTTDANITAVRNNASTSGQLKIVTITNRGVGLGTANRTYTQVPIKGDGNGAECTIAINNNSKVESVSISKGDQDTFGTVDLVLKCLWRHNCTNFDVIVPPQGGHGSDIYRTGARNTLIYSRIENDTENPDL